jgi:crotonobetainyl-CoA:carnitine CoA-transferase CaiB-like acyl-CoA transferase
VGSESLWKRFAALIELDTNDARWTNNAERVANRDALTAVIEEAFSDRAKEELLAELATGGIPAGKVRSIDEVYDWEQTKSQRLLIDVEHPELGSVTLPGPPLRFFDGGGVETGGAGHTAPPILGQNAESVRRWLDE